MSLPLSSLTALVTGGSRGIGRAIAVRLAKDGAAVAITYASNNAAAEEVVSEIKSAGGNAKAYLCDSAVEAQVNTTVAAVIADFGGLDILVNNAGVTRDGLMMRLSEESWDVVMDTNLKGVFFFCRAASKTMLGKRYGRMINISSVAAIDGNPGQSNYAASKAGVIGLTKTTAREFASRNITCNAIAPGFIQTAMTDKLSDAAREAMIKEIPLGSLGQPLDIAKAALFLGSDEARYITGQVLIVDGGMVI